MDLYEAQCSGHIWIYRPAVLGCVLFSASSAAGWHLTKWDGRKIILCYTAQTLIHDSALQVPSLEMQHLKSAGKR